MRWFKRLVKKYALSFAIMVGLFVIFATTLFTNDPLKAQEIDQKEFAGQPGPATTKDSPDVTLMLNDTKFVNNAGIITLDMRLKSGKEPVHIFFGLKLGIIGTTIWFPSLSTRKTSLSTEFVSIDESMAGIDIPIYTGSSDDPSSLGILGPAIDLGASARAGAIVPPGKYTIIMEFQNNRGEVVRICEAPIDITAP